MRKRLLAVICALALLPGLLGGALAAVPEKPLTAMYEAEYKLLFETDNVTMTGEANFSLDDSWFKSAELKHIQSGFKAVRDWSLESPKDNKGGIRRNGFTVVTTMDMIYAMESVSQGEWIKEYYLDEDYRRSSIMGRTVALNTLLGMSRWMAEQLETNWQDCITAEEGESGCSITLSLSGQQIPDSVQALLNLLLQYGIRRYTWLDTVDRPAESGSSMYYYGTVTDGLVYCLQKISLEKLLLTMNLDEAGRLKDAHGALNLQMTERNGVLHTIDVELIQTAERYGTSLVVEAPEKYNRWKKETK